MTKTQCIPSKKINIGKNPLTKKQWEFFKMIIESRLSRTAQIKQLGIARSTFYRWLRDARIRRKLQRFEDSIFKIMIRTMKERNEEFYKQLEERQQAKKEGLKQKPRISEMTRLKRSTWMKAYNERRKWEREQDRGKIESPFHPEYRPHPAEFYDG